MVCLNNSLLFEKIKLKNNLEKEINRGIKLEFQLDIEKNEILFSRIKKYIKDKLENLFSFNYFLYDNMDESVCTHMFKKGKKEGYFCHKKIRTNINGEPKDFLCTRHSKKHIPKKRINYNNFLKMTEISSKNNIHEDIHGDIHKINKNNKKILKKKIKRNKKVFICNSGLLIFEKILKLL